MIEQKTLIYLNIGFLTLVVFYFWRGRAKDETSKMKLSGHSSQNQAGQIGQVGNSALASASRSQGLQHQPERELGVMFNFNGHQWEAYQVLGVPAGSPIDSCVLAAKNLKQNDTSEIFDLAVEAIRKSKAS